VPRVAQWLLCGDLEVAQYPEGVKTQRRRRAIGHSSATSRSMALMWLKIAADRISDSSRRIFGSAVTRNNN